MNIEEVFEDYLDDIYRYLFSLCKDHHLVEDLLQETFYRAFININDLNVNNVKPWLFKVSHNLLIDYFRKNKRNILIDEEQLQMMESGTNIEENILKDEMIKNILKVINGLPLKQKTAILLCDFHELSYEECAEVMGISLASFKSSLHRGRRKVRRLKNSEV
ncbi:sigma-70 family RNA polymerase sigma factor [Oceanobacillus luteolus]|uniref:Sigma-70 family RNA polymerase sigma factor n=1 Tax=Oceanobacillus luteolus TaxID=1274358 RepID=A0ABW4HSB7_9BACI